MMKKMISTLNMSREEWLLYRKQGIGGSDAGAICGLNPYSSAMSVYRDKVSSELSDVDNESMRQGRDLEEYVARRFSEAAGLKVRRSHAVYQHEDYPFMIADVDRLICGESAGLECKTASAYSMDKWKDGAIPAHYLIQCHHYMAVLGADHWYLAVLLLGKEFRYTRIERDEELISNLIAIETEFWNSHVMTGIMPDPDGSKACDEILDQYFHTARAESEIVLEERFNKLLGRREEILDLLKKLDLEKNEIEQSVKLYMQENEAASNSKYRVTWKNIETSRLDTKRIRAEQPDLYRDFMQITNSRRFAVTAA